jgi:hypothetical protein
VVGDRAELVELRGRATGEISYTSASPTVRAHIASSLFHSSCLPTTSLSIRLYSRNILQYDELRNCSFYFYPKSPNTAPSP